MFVGDSGEFLTEWDSALTGLWWLSGRSVSHWILTSQTCSAIGSPSDSLRNGDLQPLTHSLVVYGRNQIIQAESTPM